MEKLELKRILALHRKYLNGEENGQRAELNGINLEGMDLSGVNLKEAHLSRANLERANLIGAILEGADLHSANLACANLDKANLTGANLRDAELTLAFLAGANLTGAEIKGANLALFRIDQAVFDETTIMPDGKPLDRAIHDIYDLTIGRPKRKHHRFGKHKPRTGE